jgi:6-phosphogluconolactonase (cycloisomerase 2 family)
VASATPYSVTVLAQPSNPVQNCVVGNGTGTAVAGQTAVATVVCTTVGYTVGGTISGLSGTGLVLQDNGADSLAVTAAGPSIPFTFATPIQIGGTYNVSVLTQPATPYQTCTVTGGTGAIAAANVTSVAITCTTNSYSVGGAVSGLLTGYTTGLALQDNGGAAYAIAGNGPFMLPGTVASGASYTVTISGEPSGTACAVAAGTGTITNAAVSNLAVTCSETGGYLYVANGGGNNVSGFAIDYNSGALQPLTQVVAPAGQPNSIVAATDTLPSSLIGGCTLGYSAANNDYPIGLYVANSGSATVGAYSVNTNTSTALGGSLTQISSPSIPAGTAPGYLDFLLPVYPSTTCTAYALNFGSSNVSAYSANVTTGALAALTGSPFATPPPGSAPTAATHAVGVGPNLQTFEYVASQVTNDVTAYAVATDGTLTLAGTPPTINPVAAGMTPSAVATYVSLPAAAPSTPYVYVANQGSNDISVYQGDPITGTLTAFGSPVATGNGPTAMVRVPPNLLYVANGLDNTVSGYSIGTAAPSTGVLTPLGSSVATGSHPVAMTYAPVNISSAYLYVVDGQSNDVYAYLITTSIGGVPAFGSLTFVGKYAVGTAPTSVTVPYSQFGG